MTVSGQSSIAFGKLFESLIQGQSSIRAFGRIEEFEQSNHELMDQFHKGKIFNTIEVSDWLYIVKRHLIGQVLQSLLYDNCVQSMDVYQTGFIK